MLPVAESLKQVSLFSVLPDAALRALADAAIVRSFPKNAIVVTESTSSCRGA